MSKELNVQIIEKDGRPEWVVIPYGEYLEILEQAEMMEDIRDFDRIKQMIESGEEEIIPIDFAFGLASGENPIKAWREYRGYVQQKLAEMAGISVPFLSQIELGRRNASTRTMKKLAKALDVSVDDLL